MVGPRFPQIGRPFPCWSASFWPSLGSLDVSAAVYRPSLCNREHSVVVASQRDNSFLVRAAIGSGLPAFTQPVYALGLNGRSNRSEGRTVHPRLGVVDWVGSGCGDVDVIGQS